MSYRNQIIDYMKNNQGYITNKIVKDMKMPTVYLSRMVNTKERLIS